MRFYPSRKSGDIPTWFSLTYLAFSSLAANVVSQKEVPPFSPILPDDVTP